MQKISTWVLMLCLTLSGAWCFAHGAARTENWKGRDLPIQLIESSSQSCSDKGNAIVPTLHGHVLSIVFTENIGEVAIEISTSAGVIVESHWTITPNGLQTYIPQTGDYIITFTLSNGDSYYGEFTVMD